MDVKVPSLKDLASFEVAKLFWDVPFTSELLQLNELLYEDENRYWERTLTNYRSEANCIMNGYINEGNLPTCLKNTIKSSILSVHKAYLQLFWWKITYDKENRIELFQHGEHYAPNNFTLDGEFNDLVWTKRFVLDAECSINDRLNLACCFWFETEIENLWSEIRSSYIAAYGDNYDVFQGEFLNNFTHNSAFIKRRLSNNHVQVAGDGRWTFEFQYACNEGYEHAIYFIWQKMSFFQKTSLMEDDVFFELLNNGIKYPKDKITFFLYSQLSGERKMDLVNWSVENEISEIWCTLLTAPCAKEIHDEILIILRHFDRIDTTNILLQIALRINQHNFHSDKLMFELLWRNLDSDERDYIAEDTGIMSNLALAKSFFNLRSIIKSLNGKQKRNCLFNDYEAGIDTMHFLVTGGDFDFFREYLCLFFFDYRCIHNKRYHCIHNKTFPCGIKCLACSPKVTIYKNAQELFTKFIDSANFQRWSRRNLSEVEKVKVQEIIECIDATLTLLTLQTTVR